MQQRLQFFAPSKIAKPTLLIDEADTFLGEMKNCAVFSMMGIDEAGKHSAVGENHEPRQFATWAPVAIAMIGRLPDTLEDRSVSIALRRAKTSERIQPFRSGRTDALRQLARKIARWVADNRQALAVADPATGILINRPADNWRPLMAIADVAGGEWPKVTRSIAEPAQTAKQDQSKRTMVLSDIRDIFAARPEMDRLRSAEYGGCAGRNGKPSLGGMAQWQAYHASGARSATRTFWDHARHQTRRRQHLQGLSTL